MTERYFVESPILQSCASLRGPEAHHLAHVMRCKPGDEITLFDGTGVEFLARVKRISRAEIDVDVISRSPVDRELPFRLILGMALPKGDRQRWLIEKLVEFGTSQLIPLATERAVSRSAPGALARLERTVIEASKQCGRNRLMEISPPRELNDFLSSAADSAGSLKFIAHPGGLSAHSQFAPSESPISIEQMTFAVGPEGGFTSEEQLLAVRTGWTQLDLGPRILRVETAAVLLAGLAATRFEGR